MTLRDELGTFYHDEDFAELYSQEGQPALRPWRLALVCVMQYMSGLSDRGAAEAFFCSYRLEICFGTRIDRSRF